MNTTDLVQAVKTHAEAHYEEGGWDVVVECMTDEDIANQIGKASTVKGALAKFSGPVAVYQDRQADARNSAF